MSCLDWSNIFRELLIKLVVEKFRYKKVITYLKLPFTLLFITSRLTPYYVPNPLASTSNYICHQFFFEVWPFIMVPSLSDLQIFKIIPLLPSFLAKIMTSQLPCFVGELSKKKQTLTTPCHVKGLVASVGQYF